MGEEDKGISQRIAEALLKHLRDHHGAKAVKDWMLESGLGALSEHSNTHHNPDYAEVDLSNLITTAINQTLLPDSDSARDLGSSAKFWRALFLDRLIVQKSTLTIDANDEITVPLTTWVYLTSTGATDNLDGIGAGVEGQIAFLTPTAGKDITLVHNGTVTTGKKLMLNGEANVTLDQDHDFAIAIYDATATVWIVLVPGSGGGGAHALGGASHTPDTLANLNTKVSDGTLDTNTASRPPSGAAGGGLGGTYPNPTVDAVKLDDAAAPDDNTDLNASTTKHGLLKKLDNVVTHFLNGQGGWSTPPGGGGTPKRGILAFYPGRTFVGNFLCYAVSPFALTLDNYYVTFAAAKPSDTTTILVTCKSVAGATQWQETLTWTAAGNNTQGAALSTARSVAAGEYFIFDITGGGTAGEVMIVSLYEV